MIFSFDNRVRSIFWLTCSKVHWAGFLSGRHLRIDVAVTEAAAGEMVVSDWQPVKPTYVIEVTPDRFPGARAGKPSAFESLNHRVSLGLARYAPLLHIADLAVYPRCRPLCCGLLGSSRRHWILKAWIAVLTTDGATHTSRRDPAVGLSNRTSPVVCDHSKSLQASIT